MNFVASAANSLRMWLMCFATLAVELQIWSTGLSPSAAARRNISYDVLPGDCWSGTKRPLVIILAKPAMMGSDCRMYCSSSGRATLSRKGCESSVSYVGGGMCVMNMGTCRARLLSLNACVVRTCCEAMCTLTMTECKDLRRHVQACTLETIIFESTR